MRTAIRSSFIGTVVLLQMIVPAIAFGQASGPSVRSSDYCAALNDPETSPYVVYVEGQSCNGGGGGGGGWPGACPRDDRACQPQVRRPAATSAEARTLSGSDSESARGCKTVDVKVDAWTWTGSHAWAFHQVKHWCWDHPRITQVSVGSYIDIDPEDEPFNVYNGITESHGWYYQWISGQNRSGHYSFRQGSVSNCFLKYGCVSTKYPWVKIWVHANGTWKAAVGGT